MCNRHITQCFAGFIVHITQWGEIMAFDQIKYNNQYNREHYARLSVQVPLNERESIDTHWKSKGYKSFNAYVNELIRKDMNESAHSISVGNIEQTGDNNTVNIG